MGRRGGGRGGRRGRDGKAARRLRGRETLESYREFMDDWDAFREAIGRPEPTTLRTNVLRISPDELRERLEAQGFHVVPVASQPGFFRVDDGPGPVSDTLEHWAGLFYMQQAVTGWAAPLLAPRPGERVLDLCSAPGGKTTHLAEEMAGRGVVVASDVNESRIRALLGNVYRLGHSNIMTVAGDARRFPLGAAFDRVMVDVPCSAEGTLRKRGGEIPGHAPKWAKQVTRAQEKLLRRAIDLTRPGGTLLYVTCTFGPQENEGVLSRVLADAPVEVEPLEIPVPHAPGLEGFHDQVYHPSLRGAVRFYPHHLDSGGLFLCRLRRLGVDGDGAEGRGGGGEAYTRRSASARPGRGESGDGAGGRAGRWTAVPLVFPGDDLPEAQVDADLDRARAFMEQELGVAPRALDSLSWMQRGTNIWAHTLPDWPVDSWEPARSWRVVSVGFRALDLGGDGPPRPTNDLLHWLGDAVGRQRVELNAEDWERLLEGERLPVEGPDGMVALVYQGEVVGRGFRRDGRIRHEVPKGRTRWLRAAVRSTGRSDAAG